eukprot:4462806-Pleurochrysis_carterae.AAC.6
MSSEDHVGMIAESYTYGITSLDDSHDCIRMQASILVLAAVLLPYEGFRFFDATKDIERYSPFDHNYSCERLENTRPPVAHWESFEQISLLAGKL